MSGGKKTQVGKEVTVSWGGKEFKCKVVEVKAGAVKVHYLGWNAGYDEWVSIEDAKDGEEDEVNVGEKKEKEEGEEGDNRPDMMFDSRPKFEESPLSTACLKIRMLELKSNEIEKKKRVLALENEENARDLETEKEKLKTTLDEELTKTKAGN